MRSRHRASFVVGALKAWSISRLNKIAAFLKKKNEVQVQGWEQFSFRGEKWLSERTAALQPPPMLPQKVIDPSGKMSDID